MSGLQVLISTDDRPAVVIETVEAVGMELPESALYLGELHGSALFAIDTGPEQPNGGDFVELRSVGPALGAIEAGFCAYARGLAYWHNRHRYCGVCGGPTTSISGGHVRRCDACGTQHFPRSDPAVIVLVTDGEPGPSGRCLLGRSVRFPEGLYSTLAGFVEPGESLEETVLREIYEEAGVRLTDLEYRSSQPWPFPASLMIGFRARALDHELRIDPDEIADARWLTRAELLDDELRPVRLPNPDSIARHLVEDWLHEGSHR